MNFILKIWRQKSPREKGCFETFPVKNISPDTSFLEMLDVVNENLVRSKKSLWPLSTTVGREFAEPAGWLSMESLMVLKKPSPPASSI